MRFERVSIPAYGPFTGFELALPVGGSDCHLIYGPNEAGKSSLLRAMRDLLYGIHPQTPENFLHPYRDLRIAGRISNSAGRSLGFQRRKGTKNTLLDDAGNVLPDDALSAFLGVVDRTFFSAMFGLGAVELREGAQALLHGRGELGQALFSASLAGTPIHRTLHALESEARTLYDGRARANVSIRPAVEAYNESNRLSRAAAVRPENWEEVLAELSEFETARDAVDAELQRQRSRRDWLQRCLDALPTLGLLENQEQRRAELPSTPPLGAAFVTAGEQALATNERAVSALQGLSQRIDRLRDRVRAHQPEPLVLARAAEIESLHQQLAVYRQWRTEQVALRADAARREAEVRAGMGKLGIAGEPPAVEALRIAAAQELALREAAAALTEANEALRLNDERATTLKNDLVNLRRQMAALVNLDVTALRAALADTVGALEAVKALPARQAELESAELRVVAQHSLLDGAPRDPAATFALPVPALAALRNHDAESTAIANARSAADAGIADADERLRQLQGQRARLERHGALPSLAALQAARQQRDAAWARVLAAWRSGGSGEDLDGLSLESAYPLRVQRADEVADRLREDAETLAQAEEIALQIEQAQSAKNRAERDLDESRTRAAEWQQRWNQLWSVCGITPASPGEMLAWRDQWAEYRARFEDRERARAAVNAAQREVEAALALLRPLLAGAGDASLPALRERAEQAVREADEARGAGRQIETQTQACETHLESLAALRPGLCQAVETAAETWRRQCERSGLPPQSSADGGIALLERRQQLVNDFDALSGLWRQMESRRQAIEDYETAVNRLADELCEEQAALEIRESALWQALEKARALRGLQQQAQDDLQQEEALLPEAEAAVIDAGQKLADCEAVAGVQGEGALAKLLLDLQARLDVEAEIERLRQTLHISARGEALDQFIARVRAEPGDTLAAERDALDEQVASLQASRDAVLAQLAEAQRRKRELAQSGAEASEHLQAARSSAVRIRHDAARYLRLRLAVNFLRQQIESFRKQNQAPLLRRAGEIFAAVTLGSFEALGASFAEDDRPLLVGLRQGAEVAVDGMSDGTRDQLYLALRLAAIEHHQQRHEPMPLILDDLLVTFDDRRSRAILPILSDMGRANQVLLFTHHRHLLDLAKTLLSEQRLHVHEI